MKPVNLKIKGFKSFIDEAEIDFAQLTVNQLFGISGATRSGKTSILDAMLVSLYGESNKTSVYDFINLKCDSARLEFTFELNTQGVRRTFIVRRVLRAKTRTQTAELWEKTDAGIIAIESNSKNVTNYITELLGLDRYDFTQVVIMEQGAFDKFIKAGHAKRNEMIGRIFRLDKYGDGLWSSITERRKIIDAKLNRINGVIEATASLPEEEIKAAEISFGDNKLRLAGLTDSLNAARDSLAASRKNYEITNERNNRIKEIERLNERLKQHGAAHDGALTAYNNFYKTYTENRKIYEERKTALNVRQERLTAAEEYYNESKQLSEQIGGLKEAYETAGRSLKETAESIEKLSLENASRIEKNNSYERKFLAAEEINTDGGIPPQTHVSGGIPPQTHVSGGIPPQTHVSGDTAPETGSDIYETMSARLIAAKENVKRAAELAGEIKAEETVAAAERERLLLLEKAHTEMLSAQASDRLSQQRLSELISGLERECGQVAAAVNIIYGHVREGDICPVCGGGIKEIRLKNIPEESREIYDGATEKLNGVNARIERYNANIPKSAAEIENKIRLIEIAEKKLNDLHEKRGKIKIVDASCLEKEIREYRDNRALILETEKKIKELDGGKALLEERMNTAKRDGRVIREKIDALTVKIEAVVKDGGFEKARLENIKNIEEINVLIKENEDGLESLRLKLEGVKNEKTAVESALTVQQNELDKLSGCAAVTGEQLAAAEEAYSALEKERAALNDKVILLGQEIKINKENFVKNAAARSELKEITKQSDLLNSLSELVKGKKLLNYMAEEYINNFTLNASKRLHDLTLGQYTLKYNNEFEVADNFNGGMTRGIDTLSGGETFLVSLSLSIAISEEIADTRQFEFFFIDEGFGTLDADLVEMVLESLERLKHDKFNIGLISHRQELMQRIVVKLNVIPARDGEGSRVEPVY